MSHVKVGRNDPCPCGSGKKYKKCCGALNETAAIPADPFTRYSQALSAVKLRLDQQYGSRIRRLRRSLQDNFQQYATGNILDREHEPLFSEWLWFDVQTGESASLGEEYLGEHREFMDPTLKNCLAALNRSFLSVYEVLDSQDNFLEVRDIFLQETAQVLLKEPWAVDTGAEPPLLLGRLINVEDNQIFSGMVLVIQDQQPALTFLKEHLDFLTGLYGQKKEDFLPVHSEMIFGLFDHALKGISLTFDHMEAAELDLSSRAELEKRLSKDENVQWLHHTGGYDWYKITGNTEGYVRLALGEKDLVWNAQVLTDIRLWQNILGSIIPGITPRVINNRFLDRPAAEDVLSSWLLIMKDRETEQWLDTPHEELDGQSPAQLLIRDDGRVRVQEMLNSFGAADAGPQSRALIEYMQERISK